MGDCLLASRQSSPSHQRVCVSVVCFDLFGNVWFAGKVGGGRVRWMGGMQAYGFLSVCVRVLRIVVLAIVGEGSSGCQPPWVRTPVVRLGHGQGL